MSSQGLPQIEPDTHIHAGAHTNTHDNAIYPRSFVGSSDARFFEVSSHFAPMPWRGLAMAEETLGFGQPCTAVKVRAPGSWIRSRPYSVCSSPSRAGSFQLLVKLYPGGRVSGHLNTLEVGQSAWFAKTRTKSMADGVRRAGLIASVLRSNKHARAAQRIQYSSSRGSRWMTLDALWSVCRALD